MTDGDYGCCGTLMFDLIMRNLEMFRYAEKTIDYFCCKIVAEIDD